MKIHKLTRLNHIQNTFNYSEENMHDELQRLLFFNNGYNEEDALNYAISQSLEEEMVPPSRRHPEEMIPNFESTHSDPVSEKICQVLSMVKNSRAKINELINLDISSNSQIQQPKKEESLSESQKIRRQQDIEFQEALKIAQEKEKAEEIQKKEEKKEANEENNYPAIIKQKSKEIGEEPKNGILLAVTLPGGQRIKRNFSPKSLGSDVYIWVAANNKTIDSGFILGKFNLTFATGVILNDKKSLFEQGILSRTNFSIVDTQ